MGLSLEILGKEPLPESYGIFPGVTLTVCPTQAFKVGYLSMLLPVPLRRERAPMYSLLLSVLRRGTVRYPTIRCLNRRLDELYATPYSLGNDAVGGWQCLGFSAEILEESYLPEKLDLTGEILDIMCEMLFHPLCDGDGVLSRHYTASEKKLMTDALRAIRNHPAAYAMTCFQEAFYEYDACGYLLCGSEDRIAGFTAEALTDVWKELLQQAPLCLFYVGGMDPERLQALVKERLGGCLSAVGRAVSDGEGGFPEAARSRPLPSPVHWEGVKRLQDTLEAGQSHLIFGFHAGVTVGMPEFGAMMLCNEILGVSPVSLLFTHVREERSLCYSCTSEYYIDRGDLVISVGIDASSRQEAEKAVLDQVQAIRKGAFTDAQWEAARRSLESSYAQVEDSPKAIAGFYGLRRRFGMEERVSDCRMAFRRVTREDVQKVAEKLELSMIYFLEGTGTVGEAEEEDGD